MSLFQFLIETITALASSSAPSRTTCTVFVASSGCPAKSFSDLPPCAPFYQKLELIRYRVISCSQLAALEGARRRLVEGYGLTQSLLINGSGS